MKKKTEVVVLGSGPGGYTAAFRAADLGKKVTIVERYPSMGGVCLNVGCIPSKAYLHVATVQEEAEQLVECGVDFGKPKVDLEKVRHRVRDVVTQLTSGLNFLRQKRKVDLVQGVATFVDAHTLAVQNDKGETISIEFEKAIIAAGSSPIRLPNLPDDPRVISSTGALRLEDVPSQLLIIGGGIIGLEMATIYHALGSRVTVVELGDQLIPAADADIVKPLYNKVNQQYALLLSTKVAEVHARDSGLAVKFEGAHAPKTKQYYDRVLCAVGRVPNGHKIGAQSIGLKVDDKGFIAVDQQMRTNVPHIFAIGDIVGQPMLAHKASAEAKVAAEVVAGKPHSFEPLCIPSVAYTNPEIAWVGLTEKEAKIHDIPYKKGVFPWKASGRALTQQATEGMSKLLFDPETRRIIGGAIVGAHAGELISGVTHAIEMGSTVEDIELTIHAHPTLAETILLAAEMCSGTITDLLPQKG